MRPFEILDTPALVNALAEYTARYTKMLHEGGKETDMINCKETMQSLITEIELRRNTGRERSLSQDENVREP